jgi:toxin ParE1/3/4
MGRINSNSGFHEKLWDSSDMLSERPNSGHQYDFVKIGLRKFPCGSHLIFFQCKTDTEIEIIRILHKRMDVRPQLTNT